jgi:hypothetical protein
LFISGGFAFAGSTHSDSTSAGSTRSDSVSAGSTHSDSDSAGSTSSDSVSAYITHLGFTSKVFTLIVEDSIFPPAKFAGLLQLQEGEMEGWLH